MSSKTDTHQHFKNVSLFLCGLLTPNLLARGLTIWKCLWCMISWTYKIIIYLVVKCLERDLDCCVSASVKTVEDVIVARSQQSFCNV